MSFYPLKSDLWRIMQHDVGEIANMNIQIGKYYTNDSSDLALLVKQIFYIKDGFIKLRGVLYIKKGMILVEHKTYKFPVENLGDWHEWAATN